jgi:Ca2+-binding RTX toxin-like protein
MSCGQTLPSPKLKDSTEVQGAVQSPVPSTPAKRSNAANGSNPANANQSNPGTADVDSDIQSFDNAIAAGQSGAGNAADTTGNDAGSSGTIVNLQPPNGNAVGGVTPTPSPTPASLNLASKFPAQVDPTLSALCVADFATSTAVSGTTGPDTLDGGSASERISGVDGDDTIRGMDGNDFINGNRGNDTVNGNMGADRVHGGMGDDLVMGGAGNDCVSGDVGNDQVVGGAGSDLVQGGDNNDTLWPNAQTPDPALACNDPSFASCSIDWLSGGSGNDTYKVTNGDGRVVILPDPVGANVLECSAVGAVKVSDEGMDRYLLGTGFVIKIVGFKSQQTSISLVGCN